MNSAISGGGNSPADGDAAHSFRPSLDRSANAPPPRPHSRVMTRRRVIRSGDVSRGERCARSVSSATRALSPRSCPQSFPRAPVQRRAQRYSATAQQVLRRDRAFRRFAIRTDLEERPARQRLRDAAPVPRQDLEDANGLTPGVLAFADALRAAGHTVHTPDMSTDARSGNWTRVSPTRVRSGSGTSASAASARPMTCRRSSCTRGSRSG